MTNTHNRYHWTAMQKMEMRRMYEAEQYSLRDIANIFGCKSETIRYHLKRGGVSLRGRGMQTFRARQKYSGSLHHGWKGGRRKDAGYWRILLPSHPHSDKDGYYLEHRYVVERHLLRTNPSHEALDGMVLKKSWVVHYKNRNRSDNRIDNLQPLPKCLHHPLMHYLEEIDKLKREILSLRYPS